MGERGKGRGRDGWRCWDGRGEAVGEGESKRKEPKGHLSPLYSLFLLLLFLPASPLTMKAGAWVGCQRSAQWPVAPEQHRRATCPSIDRCHSSQNTECLWCWRTTAVLSTALQLATRRQAALVLEFHAAIAVCDSSFMTAAPVTIEKNTPVRRGNPQRNACKLDALH